MSLFRRSESSFEALRQKIERFRALLDRNNRVLDLLADAEEKLGGDFLFDSRYLHELADELADLVGDIVRDLRFITGERHGALLDAFDRIRLHVDDVLASRASTPHAPYLVSMQELDEDRSDVVGEKMARLRALRTRVGCRVPEGFVITSRTCADLFERVELGEKLQEALASGDPAALSPAEVEALARPLIAGARVPREARRDIRRALKALPPTSHHEQRLAVRSSAIGEDGDLSFAGLHDSRLGVTPGELLPAYLDVVASLFNARAVAYRRRQDEPLANALMAVGCLQLVPAQASGILYTVDPAAPDRGVLVISAAPGLGSLVVEGSGAVDHFEISRDDPEDIQLRQVRHKAEMVKACREGGVHRVSVPDPRQDAPAVDDAFLRELAATALRIERVFRAAQDIEWAQDEQGRLVVLQSRNLQIPESAAGVHERLRSVLPQQRVLMSRQGVVACRGIGAGPVVIVNERSVPADLPEQAVLVARQPSPLLAELLSQASALITDIGAPTSHLATIARELHVPAIVDAGDATTTLTPGRIVTVDAEETLVYEGRVEPLLTHQLLQHTRYQDTRVFRILRRMLRLMTPLHLRNPRARNFTARHCESYHDIIRFSHEKAVDELSRGHPVGAGRRNQPYCKQLDLELPLDLTVIDLTGGTLLHDEEGLGCVGGVDCPSLCALLEGLTAPGAWSNEPTDMDFSSFMSSVTGRPVLQNAMGEDVPRNLAICSDHYINLSVHLGYHLTQVDAYVSEKRNDNHLYFRFSGGMTSATRRERRARLISIILEQHDFMVDVSGDFIVARLKKFGQAVMLDRLKMIGALIGFTRQLDVRMKSDAAVAAGAEEFMSVIRTTWDFRNNRREIDVKGPIRVIVIDDEPIVCERLKGYFEAKGLTVETFTESKRAIARMEEQSFHVAVTDLKMEEPTGMDVLRYLRDHQPETAGILITAFGMFERIRKAEALGAVTVIDKPFQMADLYKAVKKAAKRAGKN